MPGDRGSDGYPGPKGDAGLPGLPGANGNVQFTLLKYLFIMISITVSSTVMLQLL